MMVSACADAPVSVRPARSQPAFYEVRRPAADFYWAVVEMPGGEGAGEVPRASHAALKAMMAADVPVPLEEVHAAFVRLDAERVLACALPVAELIGRDRGAVALSPDSLPEFAGATVDPARLNLLTGPFLPEALGRQRRRRRVLRAATLIAATVLLCVGLARRAENSRALARDAAAATARLLLAAGVGDVGITADELRDEVLREQAARAPLPVPPDAARTLAGVLAAIPGGEEYATELISVTAGSVTLTLVVPGDPQPLLRQIRAWEGWQLDEPRLGKDRTDSRISIHFRRVESSL